MGARAGGADDKLALDHAGDRTAARTDRGDLDSGLEHLVAVDLLARGDDGFIVDDHADVERRAAHVGGQDVGVPIRRASCALASTPPAGPEVRIDTAVSPQRSG